MLRLAFFAAVLCCASLTACDGRTPVNPNLRFEGTYDLVSINGKAMPYVVFVGREPSLINGGSITLLPNGQFQRQEITQYSFGPQLNQESGTYKVRGDSASLVTIAPNGSPPPAASAALSDSAIVIRWQHYDSRIIGLPFVYRKR
ncbi:MAG TPA: hypothetical protein VF710_26640 [Longimicrobium sp.]|jgi:hypothetical protein